MYASGPIHIHIICDEPAQAYLEKRLALVERPRHSLHVFFYRPSWQAMLDRVEREGSISTSHVAGIRESRRRPSPHIHSRRALPSQRGS